MDRLTDEAPGERRESRERRVLSWKRIRQCVLRDLAWLLNTGSLVSAHDLDAYPEAARSVVNFGMPDFSGTTVSTINAPVFERALKQAILDFEPRIQSKTVKVRLMIDEKSMNHNAMIFEIEGELWAQPMPLRLFLQTEVDLETGDVTVKDQGSY